MRDIILEAFQEVLLDESLNQYKKLYAIATRAKAAGNREKYELFLKKAQAARNGVSAERAAAVRHGKSAAQHTAIANKTNNQSRKKVETALASSNKNAGIESRDRLRPSGTFSNYFKRLRRSAG
jgi:hypothetical protein